MELVVLITGANQGIGLGLARMLIERAPEFGKIILTARNQAKGLEAKNSLNRPEKVDFQVLDVTNPDQIRSVADYVRRTYGKLDLLINNAGAGWVSGDNPLLVIPNYLSVNFYGLKSVTEAFLPLIPDGGHIINQTSVLGLPSSLGDPQLVQRIYNPNLSLDELMTIAEELRTLGNDWKVKGWRLQGSGVYGITKALVNSYTRILDREFKRNRKRIRINAIHPGWVKTTIGGKHAPLTIEQGASILYQLIQDKSIISGKYWAQGVCNDFGL
jgi:NAD(P)-dependent dehydrogenase (short-subunit alcohol dehydrogenase family)